MEPPGLVGVDDDEQNGIDDLGEVGLGDDCSAADVFYSTFDGTSTVFAEAETLGLRATDNIDSLEIAPSSESEMMWLQVCRTHDPGGTNVEVCFGAITEPRVGGVQKAIVTLDGAAPATCTAAADCIPSAYDGTVTCSGQDPESYQVTLTFDPGLPDVSCCDVSISGVMGSWPVAVLAGDCNQDGDVTSLDYSYVKLRLGSSGSEAPRADVNMDNDVTSLDYSSIKLRLGHVLPPCGP